MKIVKIWEAQHLWIEPAGNGVTEEDEIGDDSGRVDTDHLTHPAEGRVLLVVVPNVPEKKVEWDFLKSEGQPKLLVECHFYICAVQLGSPETGTPRPDKLLKTGGNNAWAHQTHPSDCDRRVLQQSFWGVWPGWLRLWWDCEDYRSWSTCWWWWWEGWGCWGCSRPCRCPTSRRSPPPPRWRCCTRWCTPDSGCRTGSAWTLRWCQWINCGGKAEGRTWYARVNMGKASLGEVAQQCKAGLTNLRHWILGTSVWSWHNHTSFFSPSMKTLDRGWYLDTLVE